MSKCSVFSLCLMVIAGICIYNCMGDFMVPGMGPIGPTRCYNFICLQIAKTVKCEAPMNKEDCPTCFRDRSKIKVIQDKLAKETYTDVETTKLCNGKARCVQKQFAEKCKKAADANGDYIHKLCNEEMMLHMDCMSEMGNSIMLKTIHNNGSGQPANFCD